MESVYLDLVFFVNFLMDYLLLSLAGLFRRPGKSWGRRIAAAALGALCSCVPALVLPFFHGFFKGCFAVCFLFAAAAAMTAAAYGIKRTKFLANYAVLLATTFVMGGLIYSIGMACTGRWGERETMLALSSAGLLGLTFVAAIIVLAVRFFQKEQRKSLVYRVKLELFGREVYCHGLMDTGNCLYEPFGGKPVVLITDPDLVKAAQEGLAKEPQKAKFVPFSSVGKRQGILDGAELSGLVVWIGGEEVRQDNVVAAFADAALCRKEYQVILHPDLLPGIY